MFELKEIKPIITKHLSIKESMLNAILLTGSTFENSNITNSDVDLLILVDTNTAHYNKRVQYEDYFLDLIVVSSYTVLNELDRSKNSIDGLLLDMFVNSMILFSNLNNLNSVMNLANYYYSKGRNNLTLKQKQLYCIKISKSLDDLSNLDIVPSERIYILNKVLIEFSTFIILSKNKWAGHGKHLCRKMQECDGEFFNQFINSYEKAITGIKIIEFVALCKSKLNTLGGYLKEYNTLEVALDKRILKINNLVNYDDFIIEFVLTQKELFLNTYFHFSSFNNRLYLINESNWEGRTISLIETFFQSNGMKVELETEANPNFRLEYYNKEVLNLIELSIFSPLNEIFLDLIEKKKDSWLAEEGINDVFYFSIFLVKILVDKTSLKEFGTLLKLKKNIKSKQKTELVTESNKGIINIISSIFQTNIEDIALPSDSIIQWIEILSIFKTKLENQHFDICVDKSYSERIIYLEMVNNILKDIFNIFGLSNKEKKGLLHSISEGILRHV